MQNSADGVGLACLKTANTQCSDCGSELCESHAETCAGCHAIFLPVLPFLTSSAALEASHGERRERKRA